MRYLICLTFVLISVGGFGQLRMPALFSNHMVLQQKSEVAIWGWDTPGKKVSIKGSWGHKKVKTKVAPDGKWFARIPTPSFGGPYYIAVSGSSDISINDVLIGEVWICSGQSNMEWSANSGFNGAEEEVANANNPMIRLIDVPHTAASSQKDDFEGKWAVSSPESMKSFSAIGYIFGKKLNAATGIPIGLIGSNWGGTPSEAWTERKWLETTIDPEIIANNEKLAASNSRNAELHPHQPGVLFNGMIAPLVPYSIQGVIWYQGESNAVGNRATEYAKVFPELIYNWRSLWGKEISFYWAQIAPFNYQVPFVGILLMESQQRSLKVANTGMAVLTDIGNPNDIHPKNKLDVAHRLSAIALAKNYGQESDYSGPVFKSMEVQGKGLLLSFDHADEGLILQSNKHFEVAGKDRAFYQAQAEVRNKTLFVYNENVEEPVAIRYGFSNTAEASLFDKNGFPASPFRTDNWPIITETVRFEPLIDAGTGTMRFSLQSKPSFQIVYTMDGNDPNRSSLLYEKPIKITKSTNIKARVISEEGSLGPVASREVNWHYGIGKSIQLSTDYDDSYSGGGDFALLDGVKGTLDFGSGHWQGFEGKDLTTTIDLGFQIKQGSVNVGFLRHAGAWIFPPKSVILEGSSDGRAYLELDRWNLRSLSSEDAPGRMNLTLKFQGDMQFLRLRIKAQNDCPDWHPGAGSKCWLFADEIEVFPATAPYGH